MGRGTGCGAFAYFKFETLLVGVPSCVPKPLTGALLDSHAHHPFNAPMQCTLDFKSALLAVLVATLGFGCASTEPTLPPERTAPPASSPAEVLRALPGNWTIDVDASADALARAQYKPRLATVIHREGNAAPTRETTTVVERFDAKAYREALTYWLDLLDKPDMRWRLMFKAGGTGEHWGVVKTGSASQNTPFTWRLDGWRLHLDYAADAPFKSFDVEMPSAKELHYPMQPLGDHLVLRPGK